MKFKALKQFSSSAFQYPWTNVYTKVIALILAYGAAIHIANISGLTGISWLATPHLWQVMDILLLAFNLVTAIALWLGVAWSIWLLVGGILTLQILPYTLWRSHFVLKPEDAQTLNSLLGTEILMLSILFLLLWLKK